MPEPMTDERMAEIRERCENAAHGPWRWDEYKCKCCAWVDAPHARDGGHCDNTETIYVVNGKPAMWPEDAKFTAHARTDIPDLLAEIDRLKRKCGEVQPPQRPSAAPTPAAVEASRAAWGTRRLGGGFHALNPATPFVKP